MLERVAELEAALKNAEAQEEEAQKVLSGWQEACAASEEKNAVLVRSQEDSKAALSELQEKLQVTEQQLLDSKEMLNNDDNVNTLWQGKCREKCLNAASEYHFVNLSFFLSSLHRTSGRA